MGGKYLTIVRYIKNDHVNRAKGRYFPTIRGTWLPCVDLQVDCGAAINWVGIRVRISTGKFR